jgi:hypothetical protein
MGYKSRLIVRPVSRSEAEELCRAHPHARTLPQSAKYHLVAYMDGNAMGLASWGWGVVPRRTIKSLFGMEDTSLYLELCRFFMFEGTPKFAESKFLSYTIRLLFKNLPKLKFVYTYAAGFQGLIGTIYKATNFHYIGKHLMKGLHIIPNVGLVHDMAIYNRYKHVIKGTHRQVLQHFHPDAKTLFGYNFVYLMFRDKKTEDEMMPKASFKILPYPTEDEIRIWDSDGKEYTRTEIDKLSIIKLPSKINNTSKKQ